MEKIKNSPIFNYADVKKQKDRKKFFTDNLSTLRFHDILAERLALNFPIMEADWDSILNLCNCLLKESSIEAERNAAEFFCKFKGIGPKQSRSMLQILGLSKFVVPLDSRLKKAFDKLGGIKIPDKKNVFSKEESYALIEDQFIELCRQLDVFPCILEACLYRQYE